MTREEAKHWLEIELKTWEDECKSKHPIKEALSVAIKALEQEPRWIPCNERMPQENECVLVTIQTPLRTSVRSGIFFYPWFSIDNGDCWRFNEEEVVAWMPLPKPYEPQESEDEK